MVWINSNNTWAGFCLHQGYEHHHLLLWNLVVRRDKVIGVNLELNRYNMEFHYKLQTTYNYHHFMTLANCCICQYPCVFKALGTSVLSAVAVGRLCVRVVASQTADSRRCRPKADPDSHDDKNHGISFCITGFLCGEAADQAALPHRKPVTWSSDVTFVPYLNEYMMKIILTSENRCVTPHMMTL